jgi:predicted nucleotidyltransferase
MRKWFGAVEHPGTRQAPHRLPADYYDKLEDMTPEEGAVTLIAEVLADDYACGDPAVAVVQYKGRTVSVCQYHHDYFRQYIAPFEIVN